MRPMLPCPWLAGLAVCAACSSEVANEGALRGNEVAYVDFAVDAKTNGIRRTGADSDRVRRSPWSRFEEYEVLDERGRRSDSVTAKEGAVADWYEYKYLARTSVGDLVMRRRFTPERPDGNPWAEFSIEPGRADPPDDDGGRSEEHVDAGELQPATRVVAEIERSRSVRIGELGAVLERVPADLPREHVHFIYVFDDASYLYVSYGGAGDLRVIGAQGEGRGLYAYASDDPRFAAYELPAAIDPGRIAPPLNEAIRAGLGRVDEAREQPLSNRPLADILVVTQFDQGRVCSIARFDVAGRETGRTVRRYGARPYDRMILEASRAGD